MTNPEALSWQPLCPVLVHLPAKSLWMTQDAMDEFATVQRHLSAVQHSEGHGQGIPVVQIHRYDAAYGFDHAGSRQYDLEASHAARLKTSAFFDKHLHF
jgi:carboxymethylenebutenolidase